MGLSGGGHGGGQPPAVSGRLPFRGVFLEQFAQRLHVEAAVGVDPFLVRFDRKGAEQAQAGGFVGEDCDWLDLVAPIASSISASSASWTVACSSARRALSSCKSASICSRVVSFWPCPWPDGSWGSFCSWLFGLVAKPLTVNRPFAEDFLHDPFFWKTNTHMQGTKLKVCVIGAGAIGSLIGVRLAAAGRCVVSVLARQGATLEALRREGWRLRMGGGRHNPADKGHG